MKAFIEDLKKKINPTLVKPAISCIAVFCLLVTSTIALFGNGTLGWFGSNDEVSANNMQTSIRGTNVELSYYAMGPDDTEYTEITSFAHIFEGLVPGDTVKLKVKYVSTDDRNLLISPYLDYEDGFETPLVVDGRYYYLSSQLTVDGTPMLSGTADGLSFDSAKTPEDISLQSFTLNAGATYELEFSVSFQNLDIDQGAYENFGSSGAGEKCFRVIHSDYVATN